MEFKKLWKIFIFLFLAIFLIFNWNEVSWIFNYRAVSGLFTDFFKSNGEKTEELNSYDYYEEENSLEISKLGIFAPLIFVDSPDQKEVQKSLDIGVVHFPDSALPGKSGQTVILGHSAPAGWPKIKYDWIFTRLNELGEGDQVLVYFKHRKFSYFVTGKIFLEKGEEIPEGLTNSENVLVLISCWPPGKDIRRIAVLAK